MAFFTTAHNLKICKGTQKIPIATTILRKITRAGRIILFDFRLYYKAAIIKTVWYWHKNRNIDPQNKSNRNKNRSKQMGPD